LKLGKAVQIVRGVLDLEVTKPFYEKLGYHKLNESSKPNNWALFTDGRINLLLDEGDMKYTGLIYFNPNFAETVNQMEALGIKFHSKTPKSKSLPESAIFMDPEGFGINIVNKDYDATKKPDIKGKSTVDFGKFGEFAHSVKDLEVRIDFWTKLGYTVSVKQPQPYPWAILIDDLMVLGFHQNEWATGNTEPTLTYFDLNMEKIIPKVQDKGIPVEQFQDFSIDSGNAMIRAPDGLQLFLFKGDI